MNDIGVGGAKASIRKKTSHKNVFQEKFCVKNGRWIGFLKVAQKLY